MKYRFRRRILYTLLVVLDSLFLLIPYNIALETGRIFGFLGYLALPRYRRMAKDHLRLAYKGQKSEKDIARIARAVFINLGMGMAEVLSLPKLKNRLDEIIEIDGIEKFDAALKEGKGVIALTGHYGNWELIPMYFSYKGYSSSIVARPLYYEKYNEWIMFLRKSMGVNVIFRTESPKKFLATLKRNEILGLVPDQDIDSIEGVFVDFFGRKAHTPVAPVKIAMATEAPIIPIFICRSGKKHKITVEDPIRVEIKDGQDKQDAVLKYTQRWSDILESRIRKHPEQWAWIHKRWKTRPEGAR